MIRIENLEVDLGSFSLRRIDLDIGRGEFFILLGPTGAGKTVLLEAVAGLLPVTGGRILADGQDITALPPEKRGIGIVYQDYALFPHLSVMENIRFGLRYTRMEKQKEASWVEGLVQRLGLDKLVHRQVSRLSGGEKQRTAVARALAVKPAVMLLDEPLSALDPNFRQDIRNLLTQIHTEFGMTILLVTHDFSEVLELGSRMAVLNNGLIEQSGTVDRVFSRPATEFVARFLGNAAPTETPGPHMPR
ncbi:MAG: ATP-binding cassette domain-containing protein [Deltaproteobacteria bacterium]|nr:ATP-binding cassette domain-containing protein [Deltaproteobacteria bacterium]